MENADHIVKAICLLHNIIIHRETKWVRPNEENSNGANLTRRNRANNRSSRLAENIRNIFTLFFTQNKI